MLFPVYHLASAAPVNNQFNASAAHVLLPKGSCHYGWPLMPDVEASSVCDRKGREPCVKEMLPDVFCHLFRLPKQEFVSVRLLRGIWECRSASAAAALPAASSSAWHLKVARRAAVQKWNAQATQPRESKLSVSRRRTLKRWPVCWTELQYKPLGVWKVYSVWSCWYQRPPCVWADLITYGQLKFIPSHLSVNSQPSFRDWTHTLCTCWNVHICSLTQDVMS